jgi:tetratricopeptide (TPR) repeat protein
MSVALALALAAAPERTAAEKALDAQDRTRLEKLAAETAFLAEMEPDNIKNQYNSASTHILLAQLAIELGDKKLGAAAAEKGMEAAHRALKIKSDSAEYHRVLGTLCGQMIPANIWAGLKYGKCAMEEVGKAIELDDKAPANWLSRGVGNYYLPAAFGGGAALAIRDFERAVQLDPAFAEAYIWLGIAYRKQGRNADARKALQRSLKLNPHRRWAQQQLEKTPAQ